MKTITAGILATLALLLVPAGALATGPADGAGQAFGQHHATMAQQGELDGAMNPGMHRGFSGWMPM